MSSVMEKIRIKAINDERIRSALAMLTDGKLMLEDIAKYSGLSLAEVESLASGKPA